MALVAAVSVSGASAAGAASSNGATDEGAGSHVLESGKTAQQAYDESVRTLLASQRELARSRGSVAPLNAYQGGLSNTAVTTSNVAFPSYFSVSGLEGPACVVIADLWSCNIARNNAQSALNLAAARYPSSVHNGRGDAFRHCYWNGLMTVGIGAHTAERIASNHEAVSSNPTREKNMDLYNNGRGRWVGTTYGTTFAADVRCTELLGRAKWQGGLQTSP